MEQPVRLLLASAALILSTPCALAQAAPEAAKPCVEPLAEAPVGEPSKDGIGPATGDQIACAVATDSQGASSPTSAVVAATLAEAQRRAANLKFEVGPPPRNLTKGAAPATRPVS
jgi:hypothetical protein